MAGGRPVDGDRPMPAFTASGLRWYTSTVQTMDVITEYARESCTSGGVAFSMGSFGLMENSEFVEALANRRL
jgi:hypothetical protein